MELKILNHPSLAEPKPSPPACCAQRCVLRRSASRAVSDRDGRRLRLQEQRTETSALALARGNGVRLEERLEEERRCSSSKLIDRLTAGPREQLHLAEAGSGAWHGVQREVGIEAVHGSLRVTRVWMNGGCALSICHLRSSHFASVRAAFPCSRSPKNAVPAPRRPPPPRDAPVCRGGWRRQQLSPRHVYV